MRKKTAAIFIPLLFMMLSCTTDDKSILINYNIDPGQEIYYTSLVNIHWKVFNTDTTLVDEFSTRSMVVHQNFTEGVSDSASRLTQSHYQFSTIPKNLKELNYDTSCHMVDFSYDMNRSGEISNLSFGESVNPSAYDYFTNTMEQGVPHFPKEMISPGYSWTQNTKVMIGEEFLEASTRYNFVSIVREAGYDCAVFKYEGNMIIPVNPLPDDTDQRTGVEKIILKGVMYFAYKEGLMIHQRDTWETKGKYYFKNSESEQKPYESYRYSDIEMNLKEFNK